MLEPKLLRRPLSPKMKSEHLMPSRKRLKGICEEDTIPKEIQAAEDEKFLPRAKSQPIYLSFPDFESEMHVPGNIKRNFVIPIQSTGPPSFPLQKRRVPFRFQIPTLVSYPLSLTSNFILKGLTAEVDSIQLKSSKSERTRPIISRLNYEVLTSELIAQQTRGPREVNTVLLSTFENLPDITPRKPWRQMLLEKIVEEHLALSSEEKLSFLEEGFKRKKKKKVAHAELEHGLELGDSFVSGSGVKPQLILEDEESEMMAKAELAVTSCRLHRRTGLSLKAYFISRLPDLSSLTDFLLYLNASFNYLYFFPAEVYNLKYLEVLKLRNNPIKYIPEDINQMKNLKVLIISFNLLTSLPSGLFSLESLQALDVSYNEIEFISSEIGKLRNLIYLNLEGNLLHVLPCGLLKVPLNRLKVENNFLHAYFWSEFGQAEPLRLFDMAALCFAKHKLWDIYREIPLDIVEKLHNFTVCDCCAGPLYGKGIRFVRIYKNAYGLRLPYLFCACSPTCFMQYIS